MKRTIREYRDDGLVIFKWPETMPMYAIEEMAAAVRSIAGRHGVILANQAEHVPVLIKETIEEE